MIVVRHQQQYEFNFSAETMSIGSLKLPATEESEERARLDERVNQLRAYLETMDLLYEAFISRRIVATQWKKILAKCKSGLPAKGKKKKRNRARAKASLCEPIQRWSKGFLSMRVLGVIPRGPLRGNRIHDAV